MYCLQWLLPVLLMPVPRSALNMGLLHNYSMFMILYLAGFFLERKPCTICSAMFFVALSLICYNCTGNCIFYSCGDTCD